MDDILKQNIIKDLGIDALPAGKQEEILLRIGQLIFQAVLIRVMEVISDEDKETLGKLAGEKKDDEVAVLEFLKERVPDLDAIVREEIALFKKESVDFTGALAE